MSIFCIQHQKPLRECVGLHSEEDDRRSEQSEKWKRYLIKEKWYEKTITLGEVAWYGAYIFAISVGFAYLWATHF